MEPVRTVHFTINLPLEQAVFESDSRINGYVKAKPDGTGASVGVFTDLGIGSGWDGEDNRAILHFDTASIPDNAVVTRAYLEVRRASQTGDFWAGGRIIEVDVQKGFFGSSQAIQADDWKAPADAPGAAQVSNFTSETTRSSDFSAAGLKAINVTGVTQIRLRASQPHNAPNNYLFIHDGPGAKLFFEYQLTDPSLQ